MKKNNTYDVSRREIMNRSGSRASRLRRQDVRDRDERNVKRYESFSSYVERRLSEEVGAGKTSGHE